MLPYILSTLPKIPPSGRALLPKRSAQVQFGQSIQQRIPKKYSIKRYTIVWKPSTQASASREIIDRLLSHSGTRSHTSFKLRADNTSSNGGWSIAQNFFPNSSPGTFTARSLRLDREKRIINRLCFSSGEIVTKRGTPWAMRKA